MKLPMPTAVTQVHGVGMTVAEVRDAAVASAAGRVVETRHRRAYVSGEGVQPSVDWWCLIRKGAGCVARCGTNISCYAECAPEAVECF